MASPSKKTEPPVKIEIIDQSHEIIRETGIKLIELAGRTCYKSEDKITKTSAGKFIKMLAEKGHLSVLEHLNVRIQYPNVDQYLPVKVRRSPFLNVSDRCVISGNVRAFKEVFEANRKDRIFALTMTEDILRAEYPEIFGKRPIASLDPLPMAKLIAEQELHPEDRMNHTYRTVKFITNRGITHELVRHRPVSYSQESTRYVNYGGKRIKFVAPVWAETATCDLNADVAENDQERFWLLACGMAAIQYQGLLDAGWRPEQAREVLPNALKTEIIVTCNLTEWAHIFKMRCSSKAHPQMQALMCPVMADFIEEFPDLEKELTPL